MKDWNNILLESIIRDSLFEQASSESGRVVIRPMLGLEGESKVARAKESMGITDPVDDGFVVINRQSSTVSKPDIVNAIQNSSEFGKGSRYDTANWVYLISNNRAIGKNSSKRDVLILQHKNYSLATQLNKLGEQYNELINSLSDKDRMALYGAGVGAVYTFHSLPTTAVPHTMNTGIYFDTDISKARTVIESLQSDIDTMKRLGPATQQYQEKIKDLERFNNELQTQLNSINFVPPPPTTDEKEVAAGAYPGDYQQSDNRDTNIEITDIYKSSDTELIRQLQQDIIKMVNNNPQIYPTDPRYKQIFDLFINRYKDDGRWGTNMSDMVELMNQGFEAGSSRSSITKPVYELIIKYQTDKL